MLTTSRRPGVLHAGVRSTRPSHGVLGFMMACAASVILLRLLLRLFQEESLSGHSMQIATVMALSGCLLFYFCTTLFVSFITGHVRKLSVSVEGIRHGVAWHGWQEVRALELRLKEGCYQMRVRLQRGWRWLLTDDGMSREEAEDLVKRLEESVRPHFPALGISGPPPLPDAGELSAPQAGDEAESAPQTGGGAEAAV